MQPLVLPRNKLFFFFNIHTFLVFFTAYFRNYLTNTRHVCTCLNAFIMVNPNRVTKLKTITIFDKFGTNLNLSSAHACHVESVKSHYAN